MEKGERYEKEFQVFQHVSVKINVGGSYLWPIIVMNQMKLADCSIAPRYDSWPRSSDGGVAEMPEEETRGFGHLLARLQASHGRAEML